MSETATRDEVRPGRGWAIHSHSWNADAGGGVLYVYAIAAALGTRGAVDLYYRPTVDLARVEEILPDLEPRPRLRHDTARGQRRLRRLAAALRDLRYDGVVVQSLHVPRVAVHRRTYLLCEFPMSERLTRGDRLRLRTFHAVVANSSYTAGWIARRWGVEAAVLHPPVVRIPPLAKEPWILSVGRFVGGGRTKHQRELVDVFRRLHGEHPEWRLHLVGVAQDRDYVEEVRRAARGLPVEIHLGLDRAALERLYGRASIYWHATGALADPDLHPERMEHFGIATVEAMSAGAVPVVVDAGGQPEILGESDARHLWRDFDECLEATRRLVRDPELRARRSEAARHRAERFAFPRFAERAREVFRA